jgi:hypothetical protein
MPTPARTFNKSVRWMVRVRTDRPHGWKHHFRGVLAEVIGYLDLLAKRDYAINGEWFVWAQVEDMVAHCNRYNKGKRYSRAAVEKALAYLRALRVVSGAIERGRMNRAGEMQVFTGRIVTPHHVLCESAVNGKYCAFKPHRNTKGHVWAGAKQTKNVGRAASAPVIWYVGPVKK